MIEVISHLYILAKTILFIEKYVYIYYKFIYIYILQYITY